MSWLAHAIGLLSGVGLGVLAIYPPECVPITAETEVFCNRLLGLPLLGMAIGGAGLFRGDRWPGLSGRIATAVTIGLGLMAFGTIGEYWFASALPHQGPDGLIRSLLWMSVLAGWLTALLASFVAGVRASKRRAHAGSAKGSGPLLWLVPLPLTIGLAVVLGPRWIAIPVGVLVAVPCAIALFARRPGRLAVPAVS
jgi:hypothetical protein